MLGTRPQKRRGQAGDGRPKGEGSNNVTYGLTSHDAPNSSLGVALSFLYRLVRRVLEGVRDQPVCRR